jgi:hypothetical protein
MKKYLWLLAFILVINSVHSSERIALKSQFDPNEISWVKSPGNSVVSGKAFLRLKDGTIKTCAGFAVELLPSAEYSNERIFLTYGNNQQGQVLLEDNPPKFTPDAREYHELLLKSQCNAEGEFHFKQVPAGDYYVMVFIIWDESSEIGTKKAGGAVMKKIRVASNSRMTVQMGQ